MFENLIGRRLTDIYTVGFVDIEEGLAQYYPDFRWIYLEFEDVLVEFDSWSQMGQLKVQEVKEIRYLFELDEDMYKAKSSIIETVLVSSFLEGNLVKNVQFENAVHNRDIVMCCAAKIVLENDQMIFLDPTFPDGIGIGGKEQEEFWKYCKV